MTNNKPLVSILMGSRSDLPTMENCFNQLKEFNIPFEAHALSAHRTPNEVIALAEGAKDRGIKVIIAAAGGAAHLGGVIASSTTLPVIGVPIQTSALGGMDSLLSTVQMPGGIPVATVAIGKAGAKNAAILAAQMIALFDEDMANKMVEFKKSMADKVVADSVIEVE
ncbi:5-(carboxyamino)imidazole ribonucleotide mutase [Amedibacillus sp. YH-ame10]